MADSQETHPGTRQQRRPENGKGKSGLLIGLIVAAVVGAAGCLLLLPVSVVAFFFLWPAQAPPRGDGEPIAANNELHALANRGKDIGDGLVDESTVRALLKKVQAAKQAGRIARTQVMGTGQEPYEEVHEQGGLVVGFAVTYGKFGSNATIATVCPLFLTPSGKVMGKVHGAAGTPGKQIEAPPGYAVGAVTIKAGLGVDGMSVTYMRITADGLDPSQHIESEWLGGPGGSHKATLAGTGAPVIGIFGKTAPAQSTFNGLGLVTATIDPKK